MVPLPQSFVWPFPAYTFTSVPFGQPWRAGTILTPPFGGRSASVVAGGGFSQPRRGELSQEAEIVSKTKELSWRDIPWDLGSPEYTAGPIMRTIMV